MKKFLVLLVLAAIAGTTIAWGVNKRNYVDREAYFASFSMAPSDYDSLTKIRSSQDVDLSSKARVEVIGELTYDFGVMSPNTEGEHVFRIKNTGEDDLTLRLGATTCKCTLGELKNNTLAPGEESDIKLSWSVKSGQAEFNQTAQVITNDPYQVVLNFEIEGKVVEDLEVVPETWTFGEVATGEPIELSGTIYNFMDQDIKPTKLSFSSQEMTDLATFEVEPFKPTEEADGSRNIARQAFRVKIKIDAGMRQGAVSQNFVFGFRKLDENGEEVPVPDSDGEEEFDYYVSTSTQGRVVGWLGMMLNSKIKGEPGGGYIFNIGKIGSDDPLIVKTYVVLKGNERENTKLSVSGIVPNKVIKARLGEPLGRGSMTLYPLEIEFMPGEETVARLGSHSKDYGQVIIESDNPKVTKMRIALKFSVEGR
ncbi:MAG: DUF1573 domain-containing protein [Planctomycetaceae bacterium]|nr:DUF1573 domain-containing protein [Planctomycetaceae bacterium]